MKRTTIKDIATYLSLSPSTISRGLAGDPQIRPATRERILAACNRLGYRRNIMATYLRSGKSRIVGVMVNEMLTPYMSMVFRGIQNVLHKHGYSAIIVNSNEDSALELQNIIALSRASVDGIIACMCHEHKNVDAFKELIESKIPVVFYSSKPKEISAPVVSVEVYEKAFFLVDHLLSSKRKRIVMANSNSPADEITQIEKAYREALRKFKIEYDPELVFHIHPDFESAKKLAETLIENKFDFDAVFSSNDLIAIGIMNRLLKAGYNIPKDISVAGMNGSPLAELVFPTLTTVEPSLIEMGEVAAQILLDKINSLDSFEDRVRVPAKLKFRDSSSI